MKVQITTPSLGGIQSDGTRGHKFARDKAGQPSRQAFLVSVLDSAGVNPTALAFSTVDERGVDIPAGAFRGAYEMWFDIADAQKIVAKLGKLTPNQVLFFQFTPTFGPSSRGKEPVGGSFRRHHRRVSGHIAGLPLPDSGPQRSASLHRLSYSLR